MSQPKVQQAEAGPTQDSPSQNPTIAQSNINSISYENGIIQKKVYGDQSSGNSQQLTFHLINRELIDNQSQGVFSQTVRAEDNLTLNECAILLQERLKIALNNIEVKNQVDGQVIDKNKSVGEYFGMKSESDESKELFLFYDPLKALIKQKQKEIKYESLTKYSFLDDKKKVKVYIQLPGIGELPDNQIQSRFLQRSIELKIYGYQNKNWIFAVPKTQCQIRVGQSKIIRKPNKIIISISKMADADNWHSLHKVKGVGDKDID